MAGFLDVFSLLLTSAFFLGVILGIMLVARKCRALMDAAKASLEERGWQVASSSHGSGGAGGNNGGSVLMLKTKKNQIDREHYLDATQRGIVRALNASSFGAPGSGATAAPVAVATVAAVVPTRVSSSSSSSLSSDRGTAGSIVGGAADSGSDTASVTDVPGRHRRLRHMLKRHKV